MRPWSLSPTFHSPCVRHIIMDNTATSLCMSCVMHLIKQYKNSYEFLKKVLCSYFTNYIVTHN